MLKQATDYIASFFTSGIGRAGVLGMNERNLGYIFLNNPRRHYDMVDNKLVTKELALKAGIPVPDLYGVISYQEQVKHVGKLLEKKKDFVIKPANGSGGGGILVVSHKRNGVFYKSSGKAVTLNHIQYHISNILAGLYSLGGSPDEAIIERRVKNADIFKKLAYQGVPDIRLIVYKGVPAMAMLRLPTKASDGRANLHAGGIGVGICMRTGKTTHAIVKGQLIKTHMDTKAALSHIELPEWEKILDMGTRAGEVVELGYIGVDIVIDRARGPTLLEMNARPGISIQIANQEGLKKRLQQIDRDLPAMITSADKIRYARETFGVF